jgi:hypothetical protein
MVTGKNKGNCLMKMFKLALVAQLVEHVLGKDEVTGSIPVEGSTGDNFIWLVNPKRRQAKNG